MYVAYDKVVAKKKQNTRCEVHGMQNAIDVTMCLSEYECDGDNLSPRCRSRLERKQGKEEGSNVDGFRVLKPEEEGQ